MVSIRIPSYSNSYQRDASIHLKSIILALLSELIYEYGRNNSYELQENNILYGIRIEEFSKHIMVNFKQIAKKYFVISGKVSKNLLI